MSVTLAVYESVANRFVALESSEWDSWASLTVAFDASKQGFKKDCSKFKKTHFLC